MNATPPARRAVIDIGTNSIKLLVAEVAGESVQPLHEKSRQTRLGRGFYESHTLQPGPVAESARAVADFARKARDMGAAGIRVIATSAAREASNAADLLSAIREASGLEVEVISGELEADWVFQGVVTDRALAKEPLLLLDVGGGSTEFILGQGTERHFTQSSPLGTVRLLEELKPGDPPGRAELDACRRRVTEFLRENVAAGLRSALALESKRRSKAARVQLIGTGGTASVLGCMEAQLSKFDRERLDSTRVSLERLHWHAERLWNLPLAERKQIAGLPPKRADVILTGSVIYEVIAAMFGFDDLRISTRGLRFAAVLSAPR